MVLCRPEEGILARAWIPLLMAGGAAFVRGAVAMGMQDKG